MNFKLVALLSCVVFLSFVVAEEVNQASNQVNDEGNEEETGGLANFKIPDLTLSDGVMRALSVAGAVVTSMAGLAAILSFFLPLMGFRTCLLTGSCDDASDYKSNSVYDQQGYVHDCVQQAMPRSIRYGHGYQYNNGFKRRSLEYVGPILKALSSAYDKYGPPAQATARKLTVVPPAEHK